MDKVTSEGAPSADKDAADTVSASAEEQECQAYSEFFEDFSPSVVTVACEVDDNKPTLYGTGLVLTSEQKYTVIYTNNRRVEARDDIRMEYSIYFEAAAKIEAVVLDCEEFLMLFVRDGENRQPVRFSVDSVGHEKITTIGAMGGVKLHANTPAIEPLIGILGNYPGDVTTKSCAARDAHGIALEGSERYFRVEYFALDQVVTVQNVDVKEKQTAHRIASAPVFRLTTGEVVGIVYSASDWCDIKMGLHAKDIISGLVHFFEIYDPDFTTWEESVKKWAKNIMNAEDAFMGGGCGESSNT